MTPTPLPAATRVILPWKNGGGDAAEVVWSGTGEAAVPFDWRITIATIERDGEFSEFTGIDRLLMSASGDGLTLVVDGLARRLEPHDVLPFAGEAAVTSTGVRRPALALNLMVRRGAATGSLDALSIDEATSLFTADEEVVVIVLEGAIRVLDRQLALHDAVRWSSGTVEFTGSGVVAVARVRP